VDHSIAAEDFFRRYAEKNSLDIKKVEQEFVELEMLFPVQTGLSFEIRVGMNASDSLFVGAGEHSGCWYIYDDNFDETASRVGGILDGLIDGTCRVAEVWQFGRVRKTAIEKSVNGHWEAVSTRWHTFVVPFCARRVVHLQNQSSNNAQTINFIRQTDVVEAAPNTAVPVVKVVGKDVLLSYDLKNWVKAETAVIQFHDVLVYRVGDPNDEGFYGGGKPHIRNDSMYSRSRFPALEYWEFYEVTGFDWTSGLVGTDVCVMDRDYSQKTGYRHFVFFMKDGTFECVCKSWEQLTSVP
jgi:hypothetical protein